MNEKSGEILTLRFFRDRNGTKMMKNRENREIKVLENNDLKNEKCGGRIPLPPQYKSLSSKNSGFYIVRTLRRASREKPREWRRESENPGGRQNQ